MIGDPIAIAGTGAWYNAVDLTARLPMGDIRLWRAYSSREQAWLARQNYNPVLGVPKPFGRFATSESSGSPRAFWFHNYYSYVKLNGGLTAVRTPWFDSPQYGDCTIPSNGDGHCATAASYRAQSDNLLKLDAGYVLVEDNGKLNFYLDRYTSSDGPMWFLTRQTDPQGRVIAEITYGDGGTCPGVADSGVPYVTSVRAPGMLLGLQFNYAGLLVPGSSTEKDCVVTSVDVVRPNGVPAQTVTYSYVNSKAGYIESVAGGALEAETYNYATGFKRYIRGTLVSSNPLDSNNRATSDLSTGQQFSLDAGFTGGPFTPTGTCSSGGYLSRTTHALNSNVGDGTGNAIDPLFKQQFRFAGSGSMHAEQLMSRTDSCSASPQSCAPGDEYYGWLGKGGLGSCDTNQYAGYRNKAGYWFFDNHSYVEPNAGVFNRGLGCNQATSTCAWEKNSGLAGVGPNITSANPLESVTRSFAYTTDFSVQQAKRVETNSVLQAGAKAGIYYRYDSNHHLEAEFHYGYTQTASGQTPFNRVIGVFYRTTRSCATSQFDSHLRTVAIEGPCVVGDNIDTEVGILDANCGNANEAPVTQLYYYADNTGDNNAGRLSRVEQYPEGCDSTPLVTQYADYTAAGDPQTVVDANLVTTQFEYNSARNLTKRTTSAGAIWQFGWENGELSEIHYPPPAGSPMEHEVEVFCHRVPASCSSTSPATTCDPSRPWSKDVQWKAKLNATKTSWSELTQYCRWPNGSLKSERRFTNESGTAKLRSERAFDEDAQQRPTWQRVGSGAAGSYSVTRGFDTVDNLAQIGLAFNGAPSFCRTGAGAPSELCSWLKYDRANRLSELDTFPNAENAAGIRTCFDHDSQGNVKRISRGCATDAGPACDLNGGLSSCITTPENYVFDDFGNVVVATLSNTENASYNGIATTAYDYDAFGNVLHATHPWSWNDTYTYDKLGRLTNLDNYPYQAFSIVYDSASAPTGCPSLLNTKGRVASRSDPYWTTYYSYNSDGQVTKEIRVHNGDAACPTPQLNTTYGYGSTGELRSIEYPHGRTVTYGYPMSGASLDRVSSVSVTLNGAVGFSSPPGTTIISNVTWEPYGGLRGYVASHQGNSTTSRVEYMLGGNGEEFPSAGGTPACSDSNPSVDTSYDGTARLRSLRVSKGESASTGLGSGKGEIYKRLYTWRADQVAQTDTCYLNDALPITETASYDKSLRLTAVDVPAESTTGGWQGRQAYAYDYRGNKTNVVVDAYGSSYNLTYSTTSYKPDTLLQENSGGLARNYLNDRNGRVALIKTTRNDPAASGTQMYFLHAGNTFHSVQISNSLLSSTYSYYYDVDNRRTVKVYPSGVTDWFFYDLGHRMLEDLGNSSTAGTLFAPTPIDDYVWLGGRPVAVIRGRYLRSGHPATWHREQENIGATCTRNGQAAACDAYFIVSDHIGKPVLSLDSSRRVTGVGEYEPFGALNRHEWWWGTGWTYGAGSNDAPVVLSQRAHGMTTAMRAHFTRFETEQTCSGVFVDGIKTFDNTSSASCGDYSGLRGESWTNWCPVTSNASGFAEYRLNWVTDTTNWASWDCSHTGSSNAPYPGFTLRDYEYQRYQSGTSMFFPPLRFPGQYFDEETHLHENWHRYYDPVPGRYLQPEPILRDPNAQVAYAYMGYSMPVYAYAANNPLHFVDDNGRWFRTVDTPLRRYLDAMRQTETGRKLYNQMSRSPRPFDFRVGPAGFDPETGSPRSGKTSMNACGGPVKVTIDMDWRWSKGYTIPRRADEEDILQTVGHESTHATAADFMDQLVPGEMAPDRNGWDIIYDYFGPR